MLQQAYNARVINKSMHVSRDVQLSEYQYHGKSLALSGKNRLLLLFTYWCDHLVIEVLETSVRVKCYRICWVMRAIIRLSKMLLMCDLKSCR